VLSDFYHGLLKGAAPGNPPKADFPALVSVLPECWFSRTLKGMEVYLTPEQETQLSQIATYAGTDAVRESIAQADRGEFIEEEEMDARLEQMLRS
jgi:hypothetical protein